MADRAERRRAQREAHRPRHPDERLREAVFHQLADGWKGRPCPVCESAADWSTRTFTLGLVSYRDDDLALFYPACCIDENQPPPDNDPKMDALDDRLLAAYHLDRDDNVDPDASPPAPAHWWFGEQQPDSATPEAVARLGDMMWARTHPGARCWMRPPLPGEFDNRTDLVASPDALVIVWAVTLTERRRMFVPDGIDGIEPPNWTHLNTTNQQKDQ